MLTALLLILDPSNAWTKIENARRSVGRVFLLFVIPLLVVPAALEGYGWVQFGRAQGFSNRVRPVPQDLIIRFELIQFGISLLIVFGGAYLVKKLAESFGRRHAYTDCFVTVAYSLGPLFLLRLLYLIPQINYWIPWGIGIFLTLASFYRGIPRIMKPDPSNALGIYLLASMSLVVITGLPHYLCGLLLEGNLTLDATIGPAVWFCAWLLG